MMEKIHSYCDDNTLIRNNPTLKNPLALKLELTFSMAKSSRGEKLVVETNQSLSFPEHDKGGSYQICSYLSHAQKSI